MKKTDAARTPAARENGTLCSMRTITQSSWKSCQRQITARPASIAIYLAIAGWLTLALPVRLAAQTEHPLTGRKIAQVMGAGGANWLDRHERESEEHPEQA